ncbi:MAG: hypothetical protein IKO00_13375 [Oscillospiraceae bacterium]|nr:hypothetical protein [Oscillospiraceae bacterium]
MSVHKIKLNYNGLIREIMEALDADEIEYLQENAWHIEIGIRLLNGYLTEIAQHTIETEDPFLVEWCRNLMIITEDEDPQKGSETA